MKFLRGFVVAALALPAALAHADEAAVRGALQQSFAPDSIKSIAKTPVPGLMEAVVNNRIFYLTENGRYLLGGPLIDIKADENLTQARLEQINAVPFGSLPLERAIKRVKGDGSRKLAIFEDPDCPYCKRLEQEIQGIDNLTSYIFLYPLEQLHPGAPSKSKAIWCAKDRVKAWERAVLTGAAPAGAADCKTPVDQNVAYGREHGINGTPTMFLSDGRRLAGAVSGEELEQQLERAAKTSK